MSAEAALLVEEFLKHACLSYEADDWPSKWRRGERIRARSPEVTQASIHTAAVSGELAQLWMRSRTR